MRTCVNTNEDSRQLDDDDSNKRFERRHFPNKTSSNIFANSFPIFFRNFVSKIWKIAPYMSTSVITDPNRLDAAAEVDSRQLDDDDSNELSQRRHYPNKTDSNIFANSSSEDNKRLHRTFGF